MLRAFGVILLACILAFSGGCASMVSESVYDVRMLSNPPGARYEVENIKTGQLVASGTTPDVVSLRASFSFFETGYERYVVHMDRYGQSRHMPLNAQMDHWTAGNALLLLPGVVIGGLIDRATGADCKLNDEVFVDFEGRSTVHY